MMKSYKIDEDYKFEDYDEDLISIELLKGNYVGVKYHYCGVSFDPEAGETPKVTFGYSIIDPVGYTCEELESDKFFTNLIGDILFNIIFEG